MGLRLIRKGDVAGKDREHAAEILKDNSLNLSSLFLLKSSERGGEADL